MTWQHRTPKAHNPQTSVLESVSDADRVYQHISQLTKHGLGQLQSSGFYLNRFACPKHGGDDANASLHNHGFLYCHSHCGEIPLNEVKGLLGIHGSAPGSTHHITSPDTRPTNVQHKRTSKHSLHDHAQWSAYLQGRHILEPAIAAGAWIEHSDYYGRNCLVWHEKHRDGSRGARRRRFIDPPVINGRQYGKSIWFDGEKTDEPFHYVGTLDELKRAIAGASGELNIDDYPLQVVHPSNVDPTRAPAGYGSVKIEGTMPYTLKEGSEHWDTLKAKVADRLLAYYMRHTTNLTKENVLAKVLMSPLDIERMNPAMWRGSVHQRLRTFNVFTPYRLPIPGLYHTGGCTEGGGSVTGRPGRAVAAIVLEDDGLSLAEVAAGRA